MLNTIKYPYLRPEIFHRVKSGDQTKIGLPCFAFVILEEPKSPSEKGTNVTPSKHLSDRTKTQDGINSLHKTQKDKSLNSYLFCNGCLIYFSGFTTF